MTHRKHPDWLSDDQIQRLCEHVKSSTKACFLPNHKFFGEPVRQVIVVDPQNVKLFLINSEYSNDKIDELKNPKDTRLKYMLKKLGLFAYTNGADPETKLSIPINSHDNAEFRRNYYAICFVMNSDNLHWSLLVYFLDECVWRNYDTIPSDQDRKYRFNDALCELFISYLVKEGIIRCNTKLGEYQIMKNLRDDFPSQRSTWECGYYTVMFIDFIVSYQEPIETKHYSLFNHNIVSNIITFLKSNKRY